MTSDTNPPNVRVWRVYLRVSTDEQDLARQGKRPVKASRQAGR